MPAALSRAVRPGVARPYRLVAIGAALALLTGLTGCGTRHQARFVAAAEHSPAAVAPSEAPPSVPPTPSAVPSPPAAAAGLPVIGYEAAPAGFAADAEMLSTAPLTEAAQPTRKILAYDAPGGRARAYLAPTISGVPLIMPIAARQSGWAAVLLPSANRAVAWLAPEGWSTVAVHDQLVVRRGTHQLTWFRDGAPQQSWTVALGAGRTPTPLGRTFVLGRSKAHGEVYAGVDVLALGNLPDRPDTVATGLQGAHIGIHAWYRDDVFGKNVSNGCVRVPRAVQETLLSQLGAGTEVVVVD